MVLVVLTYVLFQHFMVMIILSVFSLSTVTWLCVLGIGVESHPSLIVVGETTVVLHCSCWSMVHLWMNVIICVHVAAEAGSCKVIELLIEVVNIDINLAAKKSKFTPLHCAVNRGQLEAVRMLLLQGADPTLQDAHGRQGVYHTWGLQYIGKFCFYFVLHAEWFA